MVEKSLTGIVTWLKSWFYDKSEVDSKLNTTTITSSSSFGNLGTSSGATQHQINSAINSLISGSGGGGGVSLACVSDFDLDSTDPTDVEIFLDACTGKVISSITKSTSGLVDTYTITYNDNSTYEFTVTNGSDANVTVVDNLTSDSSTSVLSAKQGKVLNTNKEDASNKVASWSSTTTDAHYPSEKLVKDSLDGKQDALVSGTSIKTINGNSLLGSGNLTIEGGGGGSSSCLTDFAFDSSNEQITLEYCGGKLISSVTKTTSGNVDTYSINYTDNTNYEFSVTNGGGGSVTVDSTWVNNSTNPVESQLIKSALDDKISKSQTSGLVKNDGTIDTSTYLTQHQSLSNYVQKSSTTGLLKNDGTVDTSTYLTTGSASSTYVAKENGKGLFSGSYSDLTNKPSYTATVTSSTTGAYKIGSIDISGTSVDIYGKDTDTHQSLSGYLQTSDVVDNLTSTSTTVPLSAKQGKVLDEKIGNIIDIINGTGS